MITAFEKRVLERKDVPIKQIYLLAAPHEKEMFGSAGYRVVRRTPSGDCEMERCIEEKPRLIGMKLLDLFREGLGEGGMYVENMPVYRKCLPAPPKRELLC